MRKAEACGAARDLARSRVCGPARLRALGEACMQLERLHVPRQLGGAERDDEEEELEAHLGDMEK